MKFSLAIMVVMLVVLGLVGSSLAGLGSSKSAKPCSEHKKDQIACMTCCRGIGMGFKFNRFSLAGGCRCRKSDEPANIILPTSIIEDTDIDF